MPIYEYTCSHCGHNIEVFQKISDVPLSVCDECHQATLVKLVSAPGFRLKGGGWYETDFKKEGDKQKNLAEKSEIKSVPEKKVETSADNHSVEKK